MIGNLRKRITIQEQVRTPDGGGGFSEVWQDIASNPNLYASIVPISSREQLRFDRLKSEISDRIIIRYRNDITPGMRIVNGAVIYKINSFIDRGGRKEYLEILATVEE